MRDKTTATWHSGQGIQTRGSSFQTTVPFEAGGFCLSKGHLETKPNTAPPAAFKRGKRAPCVQEQSLKVAAL